VFAATTNSSPRLANVLRVGGLLCLVYVAYWMYVQYRTDIHYTRELEESPSIATPSEPATKPLTKKAAPKKPLVKRPLPTGEFIGKVEFAGNAAVVLEGVDDKTLKVAVGHVPGTALPGEQGRIALAAHRDTFFRGLRDVKLGNRIRLVTKTGEFEFRVAKTEIVKPTATYVLFPTSVNTLTLITCYPFNYIGKAPLRYVVHATRIAPRA
jgi:sortase A